MIVALPSRSIIITFKHQVWNVMIKVEKGQKVPIKGATMVREGSVTLIPEKHRRTVCSIFKLGENGSMLSLSYGWAKCSYLDNFCKETGRKIALTRALAKSDLDKAERKIVWDTYRGRPRVPGVQKEPTVTIEAVPAS